MAVKPTPDQGTITTAVVPVTMGKEEPPRTAGTRKIPPTPVPVVPVLNLRILTETTKMLLKTFKVMAVPMLLKLRTMDWCPNLDRSATKVVILD